MTAICGEPTAEYTAFDVLQRTDLADGVRPSPESCCTLKRFRALELLLSSNTISRISKKNKNLRKSVVLDLDTRLKQNVSMLFFIEFL
jgi:hypothetical protein